MMFKKAIVCMMVFVLLGLWLCGCAGDTGLQAEDTSAKETTITNVCIPSVMIDGKLYNDWGVLRSDITIEDDEILGYITSTVLPSEMPQQDNEANYGVLNAPYARWSDEEHPDTYVIKYGHYGWYILELAENQ